jgi:hypothetical protein
MKYEKIQLEDRGSFSYWCEKHGEYFFDTCYQCVTEESIQQSRRAGRNEVVDWIQDHYTVFSDEPSDYAEFDMAEWEVKLKEWGIV